MLAGYSMAFARTAVVIIVAMVPAWVDKARVQTGA